MGRAGEPVLNLVKDIPKVGADRLLIQVNNPPQYFNGDTSVESDHLDNISMESLVDALKVLAGDERVEDFLEQAEDDEAGTLIAGFSATKVVLDEKHYDLTFGIMDGPLTAHFASAAE